MTKISKKELEFQLNLFLEELLTADTAEYCLIYLNHFHKIYAGDMRHQDSGLELSELLYIRDKLLRFFKLIVLSTFQSNYQGPVLDFKKLNLSEGIYLPDLLFSNSEKRSQFAESKEQVGFSYKNV